MFLKRFSFDDPKVNCGNCEYFSVGDSGLSEPTKLQLISEQVQQGQAIRNDIGACIKNPPTYMSRPGMINIETPRGPQQALSNLPVSAFPIVNKNRKCGNFEPANFIQNDDGSITILDSVEDSDVIASKK